MAQCGGPGTGMVWGGVTPCLDAPAQTSDPSPGSVAPAMLSLSQTNPSHSSLLATCSCPAPSSWPCLVRTAAEIRFGCGENVLCVFSFPVLFSSWISFLGWLTEMPHGQVRGGRVSLALARDKAGRGAGKPRASRALERDPSPPRPGGRSSLGGNRAQLPPTGS